MKNITEDTMRRIREIPIESIANRLGMDVIRHKALCPFHDDHHPSLGFSPRTNTFKCFACGAHGDGIAFVQQKLGYGFVDACKYIACQFGIQLEGADDLPPVETSPSPILPHETEQQGDMEVLEFIYETCRTLSEEAKHFLFEERRYKEDVVERLEIGSIWSGSGVAKMIIKKFGEERALSSGLVFKHDQYYSLYFNAPCLLFPYFDENGKLQTLQARYLGTEDKPRFQFPKGMHVTMFNKPQLKIYPEGAKIYIAEGVTDCLAFLSEGHPSIAIPSATTLSDLELIHLAKFNLKMYPDQDGPGQYLFERIESAVTPHGGQIEKLSLPEGCKDYSDYYRSKQK